MMISLEKSSLYPNLPETPRVYVASATEDVLPRALEIVRELRQTGVATDFDMKGRSLQKQLEYARSMKIPYVVIVGRKELDKGSVRLREMESRKEKEIKIDEAVKELKMA